MCLCTIIHISQFLEDDYSAKSLNKCSLTEGVVRLRGLACKRGCRVAGKTRLNVAVVQKAGWEDGRHTLAALAQMHLENELN